MFWWKTVYFHFIKSLRQIAQEPVRINSALPSPLRTFMAQLYRQPWVCEHHVVWCVTLASVGTVGLRPQPLQHFLLIMPPFVHSPQAMTTQTSVMLTLSVPLHHFLTFQYLTLTKQPLKLPHEEGPKSQPTAGTFNSPGKEVTSNRWVKDDYLINGAGTVE